MLQVTSCEEIHGFSYPKLMESNDIDGLIVLFVATGAGMVLQSGDATFNVGFFNIDFDMDCFSDYDGAISLTNKKG